MQELVSQEAKDLWDCFARHTAETQTIFAFSVLEVNDVDEEPLHSGFPDNIN